MDELKKLREAAEHLMRPKLAWRERREAEACWMMDASPAVILSLLERVEKAEADAKRYQWLQERLVAVDFAWGDPPESVLVFEWPPIVPAGMDCSANIDRQLDAQLDKQEKHQ